MLLHLEFRLVLHLGNRLKVDAIKKRQYGVIGAFNLYECNLGYWRLANSVPSVSIN